MEKKRLIVGIRLLEHDGAVNSNSNNVLIWIGFSVVEREERILSSKFAPAL